ncbi:MAG: carboxypeptidase-like regulatory domain-containing protein [Candidatus Methanomethylicus sp.]|nr:carboxypeptidase-like regulatory domain-containing protein [Candidatus Methanomethylicus sp.]
MVWSLADRGHFLWAIILLLLMLPLLPSLSAASPIGTAAIQVWGANGSYYNFTSNDGAFRFDNVLPEGNYTARIQADGYLDRLINFSITAGEITNLGEILLTQGAIIDGWVLGPAGEAIANASLSLVSLSDNSTVAMAFTDALGSFAFKRNIPTGSYVIKTHSYSPGSLNNETPAISAIAGQTTGNIVINLGQSGAVAGTIESSGGAPAPNVKIGVFPQIDGVPLGYAYTDLNGNYNLSYDLPAGDYRVAILSTEIQGFVLWNTSDVPVSVTAGETSTADFVLTRSASISGIVTYEDGKLAEGVSIQATSPPYWSIAESDEWGLYTVNFELGPGDYTVTPNLDYRRALNVLITQEGQNITGVNFNISGTAPAKAWIKGNVTSLSSGSPLAFVELVANGNYLGHSSGNGSYVIEVTMPYGANTSLCDVTASLVGYYSALQFPVNLTAGAVTSGINFALSNIPFGQLMGNVTSDIPPQKQDTEITLQPSSENSTVGMSVIVDGNVTPSQSGFASIFYSLNGAPFSFLTSVELMGDTYSISFDLTEIGVYQFYAFWPGNDLYNQATSRTITITSNAPPLVTATIAIIASSESVILAANHTAEPINVTGIINPFPANTSVKITIRDPDSQTNTIFLDATSPSFSTIFNITKPGNWTVQASIAEGSRYAASSSNNVTIAVSVVSQGFTADELYWIIGDALAVVFAVAFLWFIFRRERKPQKPGK